MDVTVALEQLRSHQFSKLFLQSLGWQAIDIAAEHPLNQPCQAIAQRGGVVAWQIALTAKTRFTPMLRHQIYTTLSQVKAASEQPPLVIFSTADGRRSLWCESPYDSALYVAGQPMALWAFRLDRLARQCSGLFPLATKVAADEETAPPFERLVTEIEQATSGIERVADRKLHSVLTLQRLMFLQQIQQKGWLAGDTWYLQTRFGAAAEQGKDLFFSQYLQPLYRCLALPAVERPLALQQRVGAVPFLGQLFHTHRLEMAYGAIAISDQAFENVLGWLSEQTSTGTLNPWISEALGSWLDSYWRQQMRVEPVKTVEGKLAREICDRTLDRLLLDRLDIFSPVASEKKRSKEKPSASADVNNNSKKTESAPENHPLAAPLNKQPQDKTLNDVLFNIDVQACRRLIQTVLPELRILDPYCGGGMLLAALHQRLTEIFTVLTGYIQQSQDAQLKLWQASLTHSSAVENTERSRSDAVVSNLQAKVLKNNIYGVAATAEVAESAHFLLLLHWVATAQVASDIEPLLNLEFNVMAGNALVGFITVDEVRFDQVNKPGTGSVLQGNLLQPLAADSYQTILSEKNIALEHYQSRSQVLAKAHSVPSYARASLLREEILALDDKAQHKLDKLLLSHMSQQLGIRYRETQLVGKPSHRPLMLPEVEVLRPFHWGYHFHNVVKRGGFDVVVCCPPGGAVKPTVSEFLYRCQDLAEQKALEIKALKTSKQGLAQADPAVAQAWIKYQDGYGCETEYFYRSELYRHQTVATEGRRMRYQLSWSRLFMEQCFNLLARDGMGAVVVPGEVVPNERGQAVLQLLCAEGNGCEVGFREVGEKEVAVLCWSK